jgi:hypothetical protein
VEIELKYYQFVLILSSAFPLNPQQLQQTKQNKTKQKTDQVIFKAYSSLGCRFLSNFNIVRDNSKK